MSHVALLVFTALASGSLLPAAPPDEQPVVFRSDVSLVRVDAQVLDRDNRAITGLHIQDFVLREEGKVQPIRNFARENMPVDVLMLLDVSASMGPHIHRIASASHQAMRVLGDNDRVGIMVFDRATRVRMPFRSALDNVDREFERLINQENFRGGTDITRAMLDAADYIASHGRREARRAIIIVTDDETEFDRNEASVSRALLRADAVLCALIAPDAMRTRNGYPGGGGRQGQTWPGGGGSSGPLGGIILGGGGRRGPMGNGGPMGGRGGRTHSAGTSEIARDSGGDSMPVDDSYALESTLSRIRQRYALYFLLPNGVKPGEERNIDVSLTAAARMRYADADVRFRRVYMSPSGSSGNSDAAWTSSNGRSPGPDPVVVGGSASSRDSDAPVMRRRVAVSEPEGRTGADLGPGNSPDRGAGSPSDSARPGWRRSDEAKPQTGESKPDASDAKPAAAAQESQPKGGWRRATPADQQPQPAPVQPAEKQN